jgi:threonine/homoserine/homoserine lactone efflux protein
VTLFFSLPAVTRFYRKTRAGLDVAMAVILIGLGVRLAATG